MKMAHLIPVQMLSRKSSSSLNKLSEKTINRLMQLWLYLSGLPCKCQTKKSRCKECKQSDRMRLVEEIYRNIIYRSLINHIKMVSTILRDRRIGSSPTTRHHFLLIVLYRHGNTNSLNVPCALADGE